MKILAIIVLILLFGEVMVGPLMIGKQRQDYSYGIWIGSIISLILVGILCLRVLNII